MTTLKKQYADALQTINDLQTQLEEGGRAWKKDAEEQEKKINTLTIEALRWRCKNEEWQIIANYYSRLEKLLWISICFNLAVIMRYVL